MKNENCNDIDWYDFYGAAFPKCAIRASQASHYTYVGNDIHGNPVWCPTTETMWKQIKCGGGWPSGNEGDVCKVWFLDWGTLKWRQGVWDPDDSYCIITSGDSPTNGCTSEHKESTDNGVADTCGGRRAGDGKCEQACGADSKCDELNTGNSCGTNGRCTTNCSCCEPSDSDGGRNYTVKGTTTGYDSSTQVCLTFTDYCKDDKILVEYYTTDTEYSHELYNCNQRTDGLVHCVDGRCGCTSDNDCKDANGNYRYDPVSHTKIVCECPSGCTLTGSSYTCKPKGSCSAPEDCEDTWCCTKDLSLPLECRDTTGVCVSQGNLRCNNKYLCDPPEGFVNSANKQLTLLDFLLNFNPFSRIS
jgi:hypothetical protein